MTIRRRLTRALSLGSALVILAATGIAVGLIDVHKYINTVLESTLPVETHASTVADCAENLSQSLGDLIDARYAHHPTEANQINTRLAGLFDDLDAALVVLRGNGTSWQYMTDAAEDMQVSSGNLRSNWKALSEVDVNEPKWPDALQLDDQASALSHTALQLQERAGKSMERRLRDADTYISSVMTLATSVAATLVCLAVFTGAIFTQRHTKRLARIAATAKAIGSGDLSIALEVKGDDEIDQVASTFNDMARSLRRSRQQLEHDALHDSLTGLPNRALFKERLERRISEATRHGDFNFAVLFIDLDHFKLVNDSMGHAIGDALLRIVAGRLQHITQEQAERSGGQNTLCRLGGDEFTILIDRLVEPSDAVRMAESIGLSLAAAMQIEGNSLTVTSSVGITVASETTSGAKLLMSEADAALYRAKDHGRNGYAIFDASMRDEAIQRFHMENDLRQAIERNELLLHFQPIFDLTSGSLIGFESLIRWARAGKILRPDLFIPLAEETGQIVEIGEWVITEACTQFQQWRKIYGGPDFLTLNVSRRQLIDNNLVPHLKQVLASTGVPATSLIIEITESLLGDAEPITKTLKEIRALGIRIYLDDFGTGYSTLSCLSRMPLDGIKIDKSFISQSPPNRDQASVINAVIQLAHNLNIPVVAEGIEEPSQVAMLQAISCDRGQGYHFGKPLTAAAAESVLSQASDRKAEAA